jgi:integrase
MKLLAVDVRDAKPRDKDFKLTDGAGLYLLVKKNGTKCWRLAYRYLGKQKTLSMGTYPAISLAQARDERHKAKKLMAEGKDPGREKQVKKDEEKRTVANTFTGLAEEWFKLQLDSWAPSTAKKRRATLDNYLLPSLGRLPLSEIDTYELLKCLRVLEEKGTIETAHNTRQVLNQIFRYGKQTRRVEINPATDLEGALKKKQVQHKPAIIEPAKFGEMLVKIDAYEGSFIIRTMLQIAPLVFQRPGEVAAMEWSELDLDNQLWNVPVSKLKQRNKREDDLLVPLCHQAVELLKSIKQLSGSYRYVFPNHRDKDLHASPESPNLALRIIGYCTETEHCFHGFRASARTMLDERLEFPSHLIEAQVGHAVKDTLGRAYNRTKHLVQRQAMIQQWADYLEDLKKQVREGDVISVGFGNSSKNLK